MVLEIGNIFGSLHLRVETSLLLMTILEETVFQCESLDGAGYIVPIPDRKNIDATSPDEKKGMQQTDVNRILNKKQILLRNYFENGLTKRRQQPARSK